MTGDVDAFVHGAKRLFGLAMKALGRHQKTTDSLVRTFIVIMLHPDFNSGLGFMKIGKMLLINQLPLNPPIAGFDLAERLWMMWPGVGLIKASLPKLLRSRRQSYTVV